ncbi:unnamed protein product [Closterium sp. Naga37s-1]|nr:unnamed protein product [Closterium sp. Naga37s-1]
MSPKMTTTCEETLEGLVQPWREEPSSENVNGQRENPSTVNHPAWANLRAKSQLLLGSVLAVSLLLVMMVIAVSVSSSASLQPFGPTQRGMGSTQQHGVARVAGMVVRGLLETGRAGRRGLQEPLGGSGMGDESNAGATSSSSSNSSNLYPAGGGYGVGGGNFTGTSNATAPSSSTTPGGNSSAASNGTEGGVLQNVTGAAGNGTEGGAVRYFTVGQEAFVWGSPLVTFFRQQATRAALNAFSFANITAVVGTTSEFNSLLNYSLMPTPPLSSAPPSHHLFRPHTSHHADVALPNVDTVYGGAFLYLRDQPMVLRTPYMGEGRYYR